MPKPEDSGHGKPEKKPRKHRKSIEKFLSKGWTALVAIAGSDRTSEVPFDHATQAFVLFGQIFNEDGKKLTGHDRPHAHIEDTPTGTVVVFLKPLEVNVSVLYKLEPVEIDTEEDPGPEAA